MKLGGIYVSIRAKTDKFKRDLAKAKTMTQKSAVLMRKAISKINFAKVGIAAAAFTTAYVLGMKKAIDAASDLQEVQGKFDVVFKDHKEQAEEMAKVLVDSYAMSTREAKQYMSSLQDLLVPMGMVSDKALLMSNEVVKLAADLGSFNNLPTATVMLDIQSALVGNFETMKKYGVILNETVIKQKALELGMWNGKGMVDANTKAQLAYKLMLEGSAAAIGDQQRTMGSYANQVKKLKANVENIAAAIGNELLPKVTEWVNQINVMVEKNPQLIKQIGELAETSLDLASALGKISFHGLLMLRQIFTDLGKAINEYPAGIGEAIRGYEDLLKAQQAVFDFFKGPPIIKDFDEMHRGLTTLISDTDQLGEASLKLSETAKKIDPAITAALAADAADALKESLRLAKIEAEGLTEMFRQFGIASEENIQAADDYLNTFAKNVEQHAKKIDTSMKSAGDSIKANITDVFMNDFVNAIYDADTSFKDFAKSFIKEIGKMIVKTYMLIAVKRIAGLISTAFAPAAATPSIFAKNGAVFDQGGVVPFASGGVVSRPTVFPFTGGTGVMGEAGPEAIMPLSRGADGELGVKSSGQGNTYNYYQVTAMDSQSVSEVLRRNPDAVTGVINEQIQRGNSALNSNIRRAAA